MSTAEVEVLTWTLGDRIRRARRRSALNQRELAALVGVSHALVGQWENDEAKPGDRLVVVAAVLGRLAGVTPESIIGDEPLPPKPLTPEEQIAGALARIEAQTKRRGFFPRAETAA